MIPSLSPGVTPDRSATVRRTPPPFVCTHAFGQPPNCRNASAARCYSLPFPSLEELAPVQRTDEGLGYGHFLGSRSFAEEVGPRTSPAGRARRDPRRGGLLDRLARDRQLRRGRLAPV